MLTRLVQKLLRAWRRSRDPIAWARSIGVRVGADCRFIGTTDQTFGSEPYLVSIGDHVTLTSGVRFVTHDGGVWVLRGEFPDIDVVAPIRVGNNVFIGIDSIVMPGVTIGDDCVIGAGSVVSKDVPSGVVAAGVPARVIRTLAEYRERTLPRALHVRSKSAVEKRQAFEAQALRPR